MKGVLAGERNEGIEEKEEGVLIYVLILLLPLPSFPITYRVVFLCLFFSTLRRQNGRWGGYADALFTANPPSYYYTASAFLLASSLSSASVESAARSESDSSPAADGGGALVLPPPVAGGGTYALAVASGAYAT